MIRKAAVRLGPALLVLLFGCLAQAASAAAQKPGEAVIVFRYERAGLPVPSYTFTVHEDGSGTYAPVYAAGPGLSKADGTSIAQEIQPVALSPHATAKLFERVRSTDRFRAGCASKAKNIADSGTKTLSYTGADGSASCTYNYTENKTVAGLTDTFEGMAFTFDEAAKLESKHRFDRLGLDGEMGLLVDAVKDGRALELSNIAPVLRSLVDDPQVMERVRTRAAKLLEQSTAAR